MQAIVKGTHDLGMKGTSHKHGGLQCLQDPEQAMKVALAGVAATKAVGEKIDGTKELRSFATLNASWSALVRSALCSSISS